MNGKYSFKYILHLELYFFVSARLPQFLKVFDISRDTTAYFIAQVLYQFVSDILLLLLEPIQNKSALDYALYYYIPVEIL